MLAIGVTAPVLGLAAAMIGTGIPAQAASAVHYVALGDSYSAGVGAGGNSGSCDQSPNAYPALWAKANSPASFTSAACSGATTSDVINSQLSSLSASTTLVSITIGGNDAGFSSIMETCVLKSTSSCESVVSAAEKYVTSTLPAQLNTTLTDIRSHAPNAKIVVLDYPDFYDLSAAQEQPFGDQRFSGISARSQLIWSTPIVVLRNGRHAKQPSFATKVMAPIIAERISGLSETIWL